MKLWTPERFRSAVEGRFSPKGKDIKAKGDDDLPKVEPAARPGMFPSSGSITFGGFDRRRGF